MAKITNETQAQEYADSLTLDSDGLPLASEPPELVAELVKHQVRVGKDIFTLDHFIKWNAKVKTKAVNEAAGQNQFSAVECPVSEEEFGKFAPETISCVFFNQAQMAAMNKLVPGFSGRLQGPNAIGQLLRCKKKWGEPKLNPKTGEKSGGCYGGKNGKGRKYGYWYGGVVIENVRKPSGEVVTIKLRPSINAVLEGIQKRPDYDGQDGEGGPQFGAGDEPEESSELETSTVAAGEGIAE
jgi:hypothetical protein